MQLEEARRALRTIDVEAAMECRKQLNMLRIVIRYYRLYEKNQESSGRNGERITVKQNGDRSWCGNLGGGIDRKWCAMLKEIDNVMKILV